VSLQVYESASPHIHSLNYTLGPIHSKQRKLTQNCLLTYQGQYLCNQICEALLG